MSMPGTPPGVFGNTLLGLTLEDPKITTESKAIPVVSQSALDIDRDTFRDLVKTYPECWYLCLVAEDRCWAEHFTRLNCRASDEFMMGIYPPLTILWPLGTSCSEKPVWTTTAGVNYRGSRP